MGKKKGIPKLEKHMDSRHRKHSSHDHRERAHGHGRNGRGKHACPAPVRQNHNPAYAHRPGRRRYAEEINYQDLLGGL